MAQRRKRTTSVKKSNTSGDKKPLNWKKIALYGGLGLVGAIVVAIVIAVIVIVSALNNWGGSDKTPLAGSFTVGEGEYVYLSYEDCLTDEVVNVIEQYDATVTYETAGYYNFYNTTGDLIAEYSGEYDGVQDANELKQEILDRFQSDWNVTDERLALCRVEIFMPIECVRFSVTSMVFSDDTAVICLNTCDLDGTNPAQLTLTGAYTVADDERAITFTFADATAFGKMFETAKYSVYKDYNTDTWYHQVTFASVITLYHN